jgi:fatty-acid desaturase
MLYSLPPTLNPTQMEIFLKYYTLDWAAMILSLLAVYLLGNKNKLGFISFSMANMVWIFLGFFFMNSLGIAIGNIVFLIMNVRGFISWNKNNSK